MSRFVICRASAGSGKTYTLVRQYLEIAIASPSHLRDRFEHILAITFTNKAANGMKDRIMDQLRRIIVFDPSDKKTHNLVEEMSKHLDISQEETIARCKVLQTAILHKYTDFSVSTIDSFVHRIVRTFAHDLNLPVNFDLAIDNREILKTTVDELLSMAGKEGEESLTRILCSYAENRMENGSNYKLDSIIYEMSEQIFEEQVPGFLAEIEDIGFDDFIAIRDRIKAKNTEYETATQTAARSFVDACAAVGLGYDSFPGKSSSVYTYMEKIANGDFGKLDSPYAVVAKAYEEGVLYAKSTKPEVIAKLESVYAQFLHAYETITSGVKVYNTRKALLTNLYSLALLNKMSQLKNQFYTEQETVHISEFNKRIAAEIADEPTPYIYERIGSRYTNYLIDEFQDTSKLQWTNFLPLIDEAMTSPFSDDTPEAGRRSLVVGDGKQAIYRFRQGDVRQFMQLPEVDSKIHGQSLKRNSELAPLNTNYRTLGNIVSFNNDFFKFVIKNIDNPELKELYFGEGGEQNPDLRQNYRHEGGYVQVDFCKKEDILERIRQTIDYQVREKKYNYGDIMVLARKNKTLVDIANYLTENSVPVVSAESFILKNSRIVKMLLTLLHYVCDDKDQTAAVQSVEFIYETGVVAHGLTVSELMQQLKECGFNLSLMLSKHGIEFNVGYLRGLSGYDATEELVRLFNLQGRDTSYVATLLDCINGFSPRGRADMSSLLDYLDEKIETKSSTTSPDLNAVNLLTIHKAKGLESKIIINVMLANSERSTDAMWVHVPESTDTGLPVAYVNIKNNTLFNDLFDEEKRLVKMDSINMLYVSMTRPEDKLLVICDEDSKKGDNIDLLKTFVKIRTEAHGEEAGTDCVAMRVVDRPCGPVYCMGDDALRSVDEEEDSEKRVEIQEIRSLMFPSWTDRLSIAEDGQSLLSSLEEDSRKYGIMIHDMMAHIITVDDIDRVVAKSCKANNLDEEAASRISARIHSAVESEEYSKFFDPRYSVKCEAWISWNGERCRPDRVVFADNETWVVDFKTGAYSEKQHKSYEKQVSGYVNAISAMGYPNVKGSILYI